MWEIITIKKPIILYNTSHWICSDGDLAELQINEEMRTIEIHCFSGISRSFILIDEVDFGRFSDYWNPEDNWFVQCFKIVDYICSLFCQPKS
jgi:hypothetical protein